MKGLNKPIQKTNCKNNEKKKKQQTTRSLFKLCFEVFPNFAPIAPILRGGPPLGEEEKKGRQKEAPMKEERKKQGYLVPASALTPNTLVPY